MSGNQLDNVVIRHLFNDSLLEGLGTLMIHDVALNLPLYPAFSESAAQGARNELPGNALTAFLTVTFKIGLRCRHSRNSFTDNAYRA
jgi:hypothetical protein